MVKKQTSKGVNVSYIEKMKKDLWYKYVSKSTKESMKAFYDGMEAQRKLSDKEYPFSWVALLFVAFGSALVALVIKSLI